MCEMWCVVWLVWCVVVDARTSSFSTTTQDKFMILADPFGIGEEGGVIMLEMGVKILSINPETTISPR
jgi:hypothetical protein